MNAGQSESSTVPPVISRSSPVFTLRAGGTTEVSKRRKSRWDRPFDIKDYVGRVVKGRTVTDQWKWGDKKYARMLLLRCNKNPYHVQWINVAQVNAGHGGVCWQCRREKTPEQIAHAKIIRQREARRRWRAKQGREFLLQYNRDYRNQNREAIRSIGRRSKERWPERAKESRRRCASHKAEYDRKYIEKNRARISARAAAYIKRNPVKAKAWSLKRRAAQAAAIINPNALNGIKAFVKQVKSKKHTVCYYCNRRIPTFGCHFDHIIALSKGGKHSADNLCVTCQSCNSSKHNKPLEVWLKKTRTPQKLLPI